MKAPPPAPSPPRVPHYTWVPWMLVATVGIAVLKGWWLAALLVLPILFLTLHSARLQVTKAAGERRHAQEIADLHLRTIEALAVAIDAKDATTHLHLQRVVVMAEAIGRELRLPENEMLALRAAALLHDVGKLAVPEYIISKPGRLTEEEFEKMKIHTVVGAEILERVQFPYPVAPIVRSHHERWDGGGYPDGLRKTQIPIGARILSVVDSFDALSTDRQYRRALAPEEALAAVKKEAGGSYDPVIVEILERLFPRLAELTAARRRAEPQRPGSLRMPRGTAPQAGLSVEHNGDAPGALYSIVQAREELQILYELTQALGNSLSVDETLRLLADEIRKLIPYDAIAVYVLQEGRLQARFADGENAALLARVPVPLGVGLSGWVAANGKYSLNGNPAVEPAYLEDPVQFSRFNSALSAPLDASKGVIGVLTLYSLQPNAFTVDHLRVLKSVGVKAGSTLHNALIHEAMGRSAETDGLTGLPNARVLLERLEQETIRARRQHASLSIFVIDLNGLKQINDTRGHLTGNQVLRAVAETLRGCLREYDLAARMGGDEFVLLLPGMDAEGAARKRLELSEAIDRLNQGFAEVDISISMGAATFPSESQSGEQLLVLADRRMYWHKREFHALRSAGALVS